MTLPPYIRKTGWILVVIIAFSSFCIVSAATGTNSMIVNVRDSLTRGNIEGAQVYLDGGYRGTTSSGDGAGVLVIQDMKSGIHTLRVTSPGYREAAGKFTFPAEKSVEVLIAKGSLVSLTPGKTTQGAIDIVFYPSSTTYSCSEHTKLTAPEYMANETRFREDVERIIQSAFLDLDKDTSRTHPIPENYREKFNFYYYYDPSAPADAFSGCAGTVPEKYWDEVTFTDVTVILYPGYRGVYTDATCQPTGCYQNFGPGRNLMKAPADKPMLFRHESGHAVFELIDTYCGTTYYYQNDPHANVWATQESCRAEARENTRDPEQCRRIQKTSSGETTCIKDYWQWDPMPDIMASGYTGKFGDAATQRISYVISGTGGTRS